MNVPIKNLLYFFNIAHLNAIETNTLGTVVFSCVAFFCGGSFGQHTRPRLLAMIGDV